MNQPGRTGGRHSRRKFLELASLAGGAALVGGGGVPACSSSDGTAPARGVSVARLGRLHDVMAGYVERGAVPGLVTLVRRGSDVHVDTIGLRAVGGEPMQRDTIFRIASMSKAITAAATMILVDEGKLSLDEPAERLLPELANRKVLRRLDGPMDDTVPANRALTVRDLLAFTMGFGFVFPLEAHPVQKAAIDLQIGYRIPRPEGVPEPDEWMRRFATLPLMYQPGDRWVYHTGSDVLGVLIARASGRPFEAFLAERLFEPLGMKDTGFSVPAAKLARLATCYAVNPTTGALDLYDGVADSEWSRPPAFPSGGGGLVSTIDDYLAFAAMLLNRGTHGSERILSTQAVESMTTDQLTPEQRSKSNEGFFPGFFDNRGWGFGIGVVKQSEGAAVMAGQYGWDGAFGTHWVSNPSRDLIAILMTQTADYQNSPSRDFFTAVYQAIDS